MEYVNKPLVGVFTKQSDIKKLRNQHTPFKINELLKANKIVKTTLYFFSGADVDLKFKKIKGIHYNEQGNWEQKKYPFTDIFYNRVAKGLDASRYKNIRREFIKQGVKFLNAKSDFNKWEVYKVLKGNEDLKSYLPFTKLYEKPTDLISMFEKTHTIYLKGAKGRRGKQIMRVMCTPDGYEYRYINYNNVVLHHVKQLQTLHKKIKQFFGNQIVIMQNAIDSHTINDRIVDMRCEVQRNGKNNIEILGIIVRKGKKYSPVSYTNQSLYFPFETFLKQELNYSEQKVADLLKKVKRFIHVVYRTIEASYGSFGEIGIDFALDRKGKLWFIECNATSGKTSLRKAYGKKIVRKSYLNRLNYSKYLMEINTTKS